MPRAHCSGDPDIEGRDRLKLLVTGGAGFIGSIVTGHLLEAGHEVLVLDNLSTGHRDAIPPAAAFVTAELHECAQFLNPTAGFDAVLHFAAKSLVAESVTEPALYWHNNVGGTRALLDAMRVAGTRALVFSSSAATYGAPNSMPIEESAPTRPTSPYGSSKLAVDQMLTDEARAYGLAAVSLRYFNVAGAWKGLGERHIPETHLIPIALQTASGARKHLTLFGANYPTPDGTCIRDYVHVADLAEAHLLALASARTGIHQIFNLGSGTGFSVREVITAVAHVTGREVPLAPGPRRPGDPSRLIASNALIRNKLGWEPIRSTLPRMVSDAWDFHRSHQRQCP